MERKGIETERGNLNREISLINKILAEIKAKNLILILSYHFRVDRIFLYMEVEND